MASAHDTVDIWNSLNSSAQPPFNRSYHDDGCQTGSAGPASPTTAEVVRALTVDDFESRNPAIVKTCLMLIVALVSLVGNGVSLATIRRTSKLHTRQFALIANLTVSDLLVGLLLVWYVVYNLLVYVFNTDPCSYVVLVAVMSFPHRYPLYVSMNSVGLITYERYIAIVHPMHYERLVTETTIKVAIALVWILCLPLTGTLLLLVDDIDWKTCTVSRIIWQTSITDSCCLLTAFVVIVGLYSRMLTIAIRQRNKINATIAEMHVASGITGLDKAAGKKQRGEMKAVRLTACVVGAVVVLWTPYLIGILVLVSGTNPLLGQYILDIGGVMGISSSALNWIVYGLASTAFRKSVWKMFRRSPIGQLSAPTVDTGVD